MTLFSLHIQDKSDDQLMYMASQGSERAFGELYHRYGPRILGFFVRQLGGDQDTAADMMHDTFVRIYEARKRYQPGADVRSWFFSVAYNLMKNRYRHEYNVEQYLASLDVEPSVEQHTDLDMDRARLKEVLALILSKMPRAERVLFSLRYEEELTVPQIAEIIGVAEGTVKSRLHKIMSNLRHQLKCYEID